MSVGAGAGAAGAAVLLAGCGSDDGGGDGDRHGGGSRRAGHGDRRRHHHGGQRLLAARRRRHGAAELGQHLGQERAIVGGERLSGGEYAGDSRRAADLTRQDEFARHGLATTLSQMSVSFNQRAGTLRGMHFQLAPHAQRAHPTEEHFLPLLVAIGAHGSDEAAYVVDSGGVAHGVLSMESYAFE